MSDVRLSISNLFFYIFIIGMFACKGFGLYDGQLVYKVFFLMAMLCMVGKVLTTEFSVIEWSFIIIISLLAIVINRSSGEKGPLIIVAIIVGMKDLSLERVMKVGAYSFGIALTCNMILSFVTVPSLVLTADRFGITSAARWMLGQPHPNTTAVSFMTLLAFWVLLRREYINRKDVFASLIGIVFITLFCASYTGAIMSVMLIALAWCASSMKKRKTRIPWVVECVFPACIFFSVVVPFVKIPLAIESFLQENLYTMYHRVVLSRMFFSEDTLTFFGMHATDLPIGEFSLDNSYLYCTVFNGVICMIILSVGYLFMIHRYRIQNRYFEMTVILVFLCEGVLEPFLFNTSFKNITLFFLGECVWEVFREWSMKKEDSRMIRILPNKEIQIPIHHDIAGILDCFRKGSRKLLVPKTRNRIGVCSVIVGAAIAGIARVIHPVVFMGFPEEFIGFWMEQGLLTKVLVLEHSRWFVAYWFMASLTVAIVCVIYYCIFNESSDRC